jgi:hypothetical protein
LPSPAQLAEQTIGAQSLLPDRFGSVALLIRNARPDLSGDSLSMQILLAQVLRRDDALVPRKARQVVRESLLAARIQIIEVGDNEVEGDGLIFVGAAHEGEVTRLGLGFH